MTRILSTAMIIALLPWTVPSSGHAQEMPLRLEASPGNDPTQKLFRACMSTQCSLETIEELLEQGADVNATFLTNREPPGTTTLILVARDSDEKIVKALLEAGAEVRTRNRDGSALMHAASFNPDPTVISHLVEAGARINPSPIKTPGTQGNQYPLTPLMASTKNLNPEVAVRLLQTGARIDAFYLMKQSPGDRTRPIGSTALMFACGHQEPVMGVSSAYSNPEVVLRLLEHGANVKPRDLHSNGTMTTPLRLLVESPNEFRSGHLPKDRLHPPDVRMAQLLEAAQALIDAGDDVNAVDADGVTTLMAAHPLFVPLLVEAGANVHRKSRSSDTVLTLLRTPLFNPEFQPQLQQMLLDAVNILIEHGADVNARGAKGTTPLMQLCQCSPEMIRMLVLAGAEINKQDSAGKTALMLVAAADFDYMARAVHVENEEEPPLPSGRLTEAITFLVDHGADLNRQDTKGMTALMHAAAFGLDDEALMVLLEAGADSSVRDKKGRTVFDHISENALLDKGEIISKIDALAR